MNQYPGPDRTSAVVSTTAAGRVGRLVRGQVMKGNSREISGRLANRPSAGCRGIARRRARFGACSMYIPGAHPAPGARKLTRMPTLAISCARALVMTAARELASRCRRTARASRVHPSCSGGDVYRSSRTRWSSGDHPRLHATHQPHRVTSSTAGKSASGMSGDRGEAARCRVFTSTVRRARMSFRR